MSKAERLMTNIHSYRVLDGDTIEVLGQIWTGGVYVKQKVRLAGIDTPEKNTDAGMAVRKHIIDLLGALKDFTVICSEDDKYSGRFVGHVLLDKAKLVKAVPSSTWKDGWPYVTDANVSLSEYLVANRLAKKYDGGTKSTWTREELRNVENTCNGLTVVTEPIIFSSTPEDRWMVID
jgi:endonuclease YncB( thermonuclease family)